jgi:Ca2+-binding EF-hand superfamily protein
MDGPVEVGGARQRNDFSGASVFFVAWMFIGCFFAMQLFVGVVVDQFNRIKAVKDGTATMTKEQAQWVETQKAMANIKGKGKPRKPITTGVVGCVDLVCYRIVASSFFSSAMLFATVMNMAILSHDHWGMADDASEDRLFQRELHAFSILLYVEAALKLRVYGRVFYFRDDWCRFEQNLVVLSLIEQTDVVGLINEYVVTLPDGLVRLPTALLAVRVLRLVALSKQLEKLVTVIKLSLPSLVNVMSVLILVIFIYSILGVQLFTFLPHNYALNDDRNFETFGNAMLINIQCLTGDSWSTLMFEARDGSTAHPQIVVGFFVSFQIVCSYVILNLLVAVILENFATGNGNSDLISRDDMNAFSEAWAEFDPDASQKIPASALPDLLKSMPQPTGLAGAPRTWVVHVCLNLGLEAKDGELTFVDTLQQLVRFNYMMQCAAPMPGQDEEEEEEEEEPQSGFYKKSTTSILWGGKVTKGQRKLAALYAIELLRCSAATKRFQSCVKLARSERPDDIHLYHSEAEQYRRQKAQLLADSRQKLMEALMKDKTKVMEKFREWDTDGDGEVSLSEFQAAMPKLGIRAKWAEVDFVFRSWDDDGSGTLGFDELEAILESELTMDEPDEPEADKIAEDSCLLYAGPARGAALRCGIAGCGPNSGRYASVLALPPRAIPTG